jgi:steroid 5-alpha reductase family enzyme
MSLSLRSFHLFFIAVSVLLAAWVGVWGVQSWQATRSGGDLVLGLLFVALGVVLLVYGLRVRKKLRELEPEDED